MAGDAINMEEQTQTIKENLSRSQARKQQQQTLEEAKINRLKKRLNYLIAVLLVLLTLILLFMRFINF